jgi:hypothetical protein
VEACASELEDRNGPWNRARTLKKRAGKRSVPTEARGAPMADYVTDVKKYAKTTDEKAVDGIVKHLGIALQSNDASLVSCTDPAELARVRDSFLKKKLGLSAPDAELDEAVKAVCEAMKADRTKSRVTFYYLLAEHYGKLSAFA